MASVKTVASTTSPAGCGCQAGMTCAQKGQMAQDAHLRMLAEHIYPGRRRRYSSSTKPFPVRGRLSSVLSSSSMAQASVRMKAVKIRFDILLPIDAETSRRFSKGSFLPRLRPFGKKNYTQIRGQV